MRLDSPKKAAMAPMSQASSSSKPCSRSAAKSASSRVCEAVVTFIAKSSIARCRSMIGALR